MADIASILLDFPPDDVVALSPGAYDKRIHSYLSNVRQISGSKLASFSSQDLLEVIDPAINSIAYLIVLHNRLESFAGKTSLRNFVVPVNSEPWHRMVQFLTKFDPVQIRYVGGMWRSLLECFCLSAMSSQTPGAGVVPMRLAMLRLDETLSTFTTSHVYFLRLVLQSRNYRLALPVINEIIYNFPSEKSSEVDGRFPAAPHRDSAGYITVDSGLTGSIAPSHVHEYYLLGALCYIALGKWEEAMLFLELILASPNASQANGFMLEAYRKWVLVGCIINGRPPEIPKSFNQSAVRMIRQASKAYDALGDIFQSGDRSHLQAEIDAGVAVWSDDGNMGLVDMLLRQLPWFLLQDLQRIYSAIPIMTVASELGLPPENAHAYLENLISGRLVNASIEYPQDGEAILRFYPNLSSGPLAKTEQQHHRAIIEQKVRIDKLSDQVKMADARLSVTRYWVDHLKKRKDKNEDGAEREQAEQMPWSATGDADGDEDLMDSMDMA